jgi:hypothetical protein
MSNGLKLTAVAATVAVAAAVSPSWSRSDTAPSRTLTLVGKEATSAFLDHGRDGTPSVGDEFVSAQRLLRRGKVVGRSGGACQVVAPAPGRDRNTFHCSLTLRLPGGQIALEGLGTFGQEGPQPLAMAITGGTGSYRAARGQASVREQRGGETHYRLSIRR